MIVDENTNEEITARGPDARGELWCRGPNIMKGYDLQVFLRSIVVCLLTALSTATGTTRKPPKRRSPQMDGSRLVTLPTLVSFRHVIVVVVCPDHG